ncbi:hypothetical protein NMY22_g19360 [Coprinellus aureogranulatus]|nr:hypothetical protein NMY22_g19360 [Coprinellus aureogranulatus]
MITIRLLKERRKLLEILPNCPQEMLTTYTGSIALIVESAAPLSVFGTAYAIVIITTLSTDRNVLEKGVAMYIFSVLYFSFAALSPQMIVFRVVTGRSWINELHKSIVDACAIEAAIDFSSLHFENCMADGYDRPPL